LIHIGFFKKPTELVVDLMRRCCKADHLGVGVTVRLGLGLTVRYSDLGVVRDTVGNARGLDFVGY